MKPHVTSSLISLLSAWLFGARLVSAQPGGELLTNAVDVLSLPAERAAQGIPVSIRGVVTAGESDWGGRFFVQDSTGGVFVENISERQPAPGDLVEVSGVSHPGAFAPIITKPDWKKLGTAPLPIARPVAIDQLMAGLEDSQRVEISGIVRAVRVEKSILVFDLVAGGYRLHVYARIPAGIDPPSLIAAKVRVRGTAATSYNAQLRRLITVLMFAPLVSDFIIDENQTVNPFDEPVTSLKGVAQYRRDFAPSQRIHVQGTVTYQRPGEYLFVQDGTGGLQIKTRQPDIFEPGDTVEAIGFRDFEHFLPVLQDAHVRKAPGPDVSVNPEAVSVDELQQGLHHAALVTLKGKVIDSINRHARQPSGTDVTKTIYTLQSTELLFTAELTAPGPGDGAAPVPVGSTVEVSGVCLTQIAEDGKFESLQLLLPGAASIRVLQRPSWWTPQRLVIGLAALFAGLLAAVSWTVMVAKRNAALKVLVREKEQAQEELQHAHDELEERVRQRTEQLKLQITARKDSELQFKAVLAERTRLAQELHDTLEQTLTGIALQMDTASKIVEKKPQDASHHLDLARNLVAQGQLEVRRSVWDLRSRGLEEFDLPGALVASSRQLTDGTSIQVEVAAKGRVRPLSDIVEDNLLRIAQEALTNVIKHAEATAVKIDLDYGPQNVVLQIADNGRGFAVDHCPGPGDGHFGLLGMSERAKRLSGEVSVTSAPGAGATVRVQIPVAPAEQDNRREAAHVAMGS